MSENLLNALMELVALFARVNKTRFIDNAHALVKMYLEQTLSRSNSRIHIRKFYDYFEFYSQKQQEGIVDETFLREYILEITKRLNTELTEEERMIILLSFLELVKLDKKIDTNELSFLEILAKELHISKSDYQNSLLFILSNNPDQEFNNSFLLISQDENKNLDELEGIWIDQNRPASIENKYYSVKKNIEGDLLIIRFQGVHFIAARYFGNQTYHLNNRKILPGKFILINQFDQLRIGSSEKISYQELLSGYKHQGPYSELKLTGCNVSISESTKSISIAPFNFAEVPGNLVAILCNNPSESNNICRLLIGQIPFSSGEICLNGYNIVSDKYKIHKLIGYVPKQPVFDENISIQNNFWIAARMAFPNYSELKINQLVEQVKISLNLEEISLVPIFKIITQISREYLYVLINTGLEIIRDPFVLILDLPLENLNSSYAEEYLNILKSESARGKLIFITTTNPGHNFLKKIDRIWIFDSGGYIIYNGLVNNVISYFKSVKSNIAAEEEFCPFCGNINPDQLNRLIHSKIIDKQGKTTLERKTTPKEWYKIYKEKIDNKDVLITNQKVLPSSAASIPNIDLQFFSYLRKLALSRFSFVLKQCFFISLGPILALLISGLLRNDWSNAYHFNQHENLPLLFFLNVVACLCIGIFIGFEGSGKEKIQIAHDYFKNYSFFSFLNAKVIILTLLTIITSLLFTYTTNSISNIQGVFLSNWLIYFSIISLGNLFGLLLGYIRISNSLLVLLLALFFGANAFFAGYLIPYSSFPKQLLSKKYTPVFVEIIPTRWAFEALIVSQINGNEFKKIFYNTEQTLSDLKFKINYLIPILQEKTNRIKEDNNYLSKNNSINLVFNELTKIIKQYPDIFPFEYVNELSKPNIKIEIINELEGYLTYLQIQLFEKNKETLKTLESLKARMQDSIGKVNYLQHLENTNNPSLINYLSSDNLENRYLNSNDQIIQLDDKIYRLPDNNFGRAHLFAPKKLMNGYYYDTVVFNVFIIWLHVFLIYIFILIFRVKRCKAVSIKY